MTNPDKKTFTTIIFDLDSTLVTIEGLDWLAERKGIKKEVATLTRLAMEGKIPMQEAFIRKVGMVSPSRQDLQYLGKKYCRSLVPGARELINELRQQQKQLYIVTGSFAPAARLLALHLNISPRNVRANQIYFNRQGNYQGFNRRSPLAKNGGKAKVIRKLAGAERRTALIGDGCTDLEARSVVNRFIGFGGVVERPLVKREASYFISAPNLLCLLNLL